MWFTWFFTLENGPPSPSSPSPAEPEIWSVWFQRNRRGAAASAACSRIKCTPDMSVLMTLFITGWPDFTVRIMTCVKEHFRPWLLDKKIDSLSYLPYYCWADSDNFIHLLVVIQSDWVKNPQQQNIQNLFFCVHYTQIKQGPRYCRKAHRNCNNSKQFWNWSLQKKPKQTMSFQSLTLSNSSWKILLVLQYAYCKIYSKMYLFCFCFFTCNITFDTHILTHSNCDI